MVHGNNCPSVEDTRPELLRHERESSSHRAVHSVLSLMRHSGYLRFLTKFMRLSRHTSPCVLPCAVPVPANSSACMPTCSGDAHARCTCIRLLPWNWATHLILTGCCGSVRCRVSTLRRLGPFEAVPWQEVVRRVAAPAKR